MIAVLDIPMIGEDLTSDINRRVDEYNRALRAAAVHAAECGCLSAARGGSSMI
jgi:hypothetical protein